MLIKRSKAGTMRVSLTLSLRFCLDVCRVPSLQHCDKMLISCPQRTRIFKFAFLVLNTTWCAFCRTSGWFHSNRSKFNNLFRPNNKMLGSKVLSERPFITRLLKMCTQVPVMLFSLTLTLQDPALCCGRLQEVIWRRPPRVSSAGSAAAWR